jgi:hypothetical protein
MKEDYFLLSQITNRQIAKQFLIYQKALAENLAELIFETKGSITETALDIIRYYFPENKRIYAFQILYFRLKPQISKEELKEILSKIKSKLPFTTFIDFIPLRNILVFIFNNVLLVEEKRSLMLSLEELKEEEIPEDIRPYITINEEAKLLLKDII